MTMGWFTLRSLLKHYLFWILFFIGGRIIFLCFNYEKLANENISEVFQTFQYALYLDNSTAAYFLAITFLLLLLHSLFRARILLIVNKVYSYLLIAVGSLVTISELAIYKEWNVKLNYKAISYLARPAEIFQSAEPWFLLFGFLAVAIIIALAIIAYNRFVFEEYKDRKRSIWFSISFFLTVPVALLLLLRGGAQPIPIHQGDVYFSKSDFLNLATVNSVWNLGSSIDKNTRYMTANPFVVMDDKTANDLFSLLHKAEKDTTVSVIDVPKPNLVFIILESWSADVVGSFNGLKGITPNIDSISTNGIMFLNCYSPGTLSDEGMVSIFSGFPALPEVIITNQPDKYGKLPCFARYLQDEGYTTSFHFGGELGYGNIRSYLYFNKFDQIIEIDDFPDDIPRGRLGVHDEFMLDRFLADIGEKKEPFMAAAFTLSSHSPFDEPYADKFSDYDEYNAYLNSVAYTDSCLGVFFRKAATTDWYKNTLFVIVADHSHPTPLSKGYFSHAYRRIPLIFFGNVINREWIGNVQSGICSQCDIGATVLKQLNLEKEIYHCSKNLFNPYRKNFWYFGFNHGVGLYSEKENYFVYDYEMNRYFEQSYDAGSDTAQFIRTGKAVLQVLFGEYQEL